MRIGFVGAGNMAGAMARGWSAAERGPEELLFSDAGSGRAAALAEEVGGRAAELAGLAGQVDLVLLACKPAQLEAAAAALGDVPAVASVLGSTSLARLAEAFPGVPVIRLMPNTPVEVGQGVVCYCAGDGVPDDLDAELRGLLEALGAVVVLDERLMEAATAVMSCTPAYFALVAEALADAAVHQGIDAARAQQLVVETMAGTAGLLRRHDTLAVRRAVTSPGGVTAAGLAALERGGVRAAFADAVKASLEKMRA